MSTKLIPVKAFLGKYYLDLLSTSRQKKYKDTHLSTFFEQRFYNQNNKVQMVVQPEGDGLFLSISGNEIHISKELYDHPNIIISNSLEHGGNTISKHLYNATTFSTIAYLVCQNHTTVHIIGKVDEPIYLRYSSEYESFFNSVVIVDVDKGIDVEIVEESESLCALNTVTNYILNDSSSLNLTTFYQTLKSGISFNYRNVIARENSKFSHILLGKGASSVIDETRIQPFSNSCAELRGIIDSADRNFHSILTIDSEVDDYSISVNYKNILTSNSNVSYLPVIIGIEPVTFPASIDISSMSIDEIPLDIVVDEIKTYLKDISDRTTLGRILGVSRFYENKAGFLTF